MTAFDRIDRFDRFEREIPELMDALAPTHLPDYFDDMLLATARTRQRPAWRTLERWLPMGEIARSVPRAPLPWRPIILFVGLTLIVLAGIMAVAGSAPKLPPPIGLAANGVIVFSTATGDIIAADPATGLATTIIGGETDDTDPWFANDGQRFVFQRRSPGLADTALYVAEGDGSDVRELLASTPQVDRLAWSPGGDRFVLSLETDTPGLVRIVDADDGSATTFDLGMEVVAFAWRPGHDELVVTEVTPDPGGGTYAFYVVGVDGTGLRQVPTAAGAVNEPAVSPDGSTLAYSTWVTGAEGRTRLVDIDSGVERPIDFDPGFVYADLVPTFTPNGEALIVERYIGTEYQPTIVPLDGSPVIAFGEPHPEMTNGFTRTISPDGEQLLVTYQDDGTTWLYDVATGEGQQMDWDIPLGVAASWQRLAP